VARVVLAPALARWLPGGGDGDAVLEDVAGANVAEVLEGVFARHPSLRSYVVDEQGAVRHHVALFVDGRSLARKTRLDHPLGERAELHVLQALSGG
jgi:molybdopterin synthase sulfur carrier subunit